MMLAMKTGKKNGIVRVGRAVLSLLLALFFVVGSIPPASADSTYYIYIKKDNTTLRTGPGSGYASAGAISKAGKINYLGIGFDANNNVWYKVGSASGKNGWVSASEAERHYKNSAKPAGALPSSYSSDGTEYNDIMAQLYKSASAYGAVGAQLSVVRGSDGAQFNWSYGWSEYGKKRMGITTKVGVGEISETAVAVCAMKMKENGLLQISGAIDGIWGIKMPSAVSLSMLLTNSSGLKSLPAQNGIKSAAAMLSDPSSFTSGVTAGTAGAWKRSSFGTGAAAATLELAVNETLERFAQDNLFGVLDADMSFFAGGVKSTKKLASRYGSGLSVNLLSSEAKTIKPSTAIGQGQISYTNGLTSSTQDIAKMFYMLANDGAYKDKRVLTTASVASMEKKHLTVKENGGEFRQCIGLRYIKSLYGTKGLYYNMGRANGMISFACYDPTTKNTVAVTLSGAKVTYDKNGIYKVCGDIVKYVYSTLADKERTLYSDITKKGKALHLGDTIGIVAPSYTMEEADFNRAVTFLQKMGYNVKIAPSCKLRYKLYAGSDKQRAKDINNFFADDSVDAILCMRGGNGASRLLELLDYDLIAKNPKLFIGYSDITALHIALYQKSNITSVHGAMLTSFTSKINQYTADQFFDGIRRSTPIGEIELPKDRELETMVSGKAEGPLIGGNLSVIASLVGTEYELKGDHCILLIEELDESASTIDRMLTQLQLNGLFDRVDGVIFGDFTDCPAYEGITAKTVIHDFVAKIGKPVIWGVPCGHSGINMFMPLGTHVRMTAKKDGSASLKILESALVK